MHASRILLSAILPLATASLCAQDIGSKAPDIEWQKTFGFGTMPAKKLSDLRGSVVLLEFIGTYSRDSRTEIPAMNKLQENLEGRGLVVIGLTTEEEKAVKDYIEEYEVKHPVAVAIYSGYRLQTVPYAYLIDQEGKIAWRGHPSQIGEGTLNKALAGAKPAWVQKGLEQVYQMRFGQQNGEAYKLATKMLERSELSDPAQRQAKEWIEEMETFVKTSLAAADELEKDKRVDVYQLWTKLQPVAEHYVGVPGAEPAIKRLEALMKENKNQQEVEAGQMFAEAERKEADFDFNGAIELYKEIGRKLGRTRVGKNAKLRERELMDKGMLGYDHSCNYCKAGGCACPTHARKK